MERRFFVSGFFLFQVSRFESNLKVPRGTLADLFSKPKSEYIMFHVKHFKNKPKTNLNFHVPRETSFDLISFFQSILYVPRETLCEKLFQLKSVSRGTTFNFLFVGLKLET